MRAIRIPYKTAQEIRSILARFDNSQMEEINTVEVVSAIQRIDAAMKLRPSVRLAKARKKETKAERQNEWAQIREKVLARANGFCECCCAPSATLEVDHFLGGSGRRRTLQSLWTCWALTPLHHLQKTRNQFGAEEWHGRFIKHCYRQTEGRLAVDCGYDRAREIAQARLDALAIQQQLPHGRKSK